MRHPGPHAEAARPLIARAAGPLRLPDDPVLIARASGAITTGAGVLLALGRLPRLSALAVLVTAPITQAPPPFWQEKDPELRRQQRAIFVRNLGVLGGALLAAVDTEGRPGLAWRGRHTAQDAQREAAHAAATAKRAAKRARRDAKYQAKLAKAQAQAAPVKVVKAAKQAVT